MLLIIKLVVDEAFSAIFKDGAGRSARWWWPRPETDTFWHGVIMRSLVVVALALFFGFSHFEITIAILTAIYVALTGLYAYTSHKTLDAIKRQAEISDKSVNAQIASQSAWIMADVGFTPGYPGRTLTSSSEHGELVDRTAICVRVTYVNKEQTPAWITDKRITFSIDKEGIALPRIPEPDLSQMIQHEPEPLAAGEISTKDFPLFAAGIQGLGDVAIVQGTIRYRDVFGRENRFTSFCYRLTLGNRLERVSDHANTSN